MGKKITLIALLSVLCLMQGSNCFAAKTVAKAKPVAPESNSYFYAPAGIVCDAVLSENINSFSTVVGQNVSVILLDDLKYKGKTIASSGSTIFGTVTQNKINGQGSDATKLRIRFTTIRTPYNNVIPVSAVVLTKDKTGYILASSDKNSSDSVILSANSKINLLFDQPITVTAQ